MALKWMDKQEVSLLSAYHGNEVTKTKTHHVEKENAVAVVTDNNNMGALVDADEMLVAYLVEHMRHKI